MRILCSTIVSMVLCSVLVNYASGQADGQDTIRLVNGSHPLEGRVEILVNGTWGPVCDFIWSSDETKVVCRQLGYNSTRIRHYSGSYFGQGPAPYHQTNGYFQCKGSEPRLLNCPIKASSICKIKDRADAGVSCDTTQDTDDCANHQCENGARCVDHNRYYTCSCRQGFTGARCELDVNECASNPCQNGGTCHNHVGHFTCTCSPGFTDQFCHFRDLPGHGSVRLVNGSQPGEGLVQILANGTWGAVCGFFWGNTDAQVVCRQLGYDTRTAKSYEVDVARGELVSTTWMDSVDCRGNETRLVDCSPRLAEKHTCWTSQYAGVTCGPLLDKTTTSSVAGPATSPALVFTTDTQHSKITESIDTHSTTLSSGNESNALENNINTKDDINWGAVAGGIVAVVVVVALVVVVVVLWRRGRLGGILCKSPVYDNPKKVPDEQDAQTYTDLSVYEVIDNDVMGGNPVYDALEKEKNRESTLYTSLNVTSDMGATNNIPEGRNPVYDALEKEKSRESRLYTSLNVTSDMGATNNIPEGKQQSTSEPVYQNTAATEEERYL